MGSRFEITAIHEDPQMARSGVHLAIEEITRIESTISSWMPDSETSLVNQHAGIRPVAVSGELFNLIARSIKVSELTGGAFDITFAALNEVWKFNQGIIRQLDSSKIKALMPLVNYRNIVLDHTHQTVWLKEKEMRIGLGAIGKGYAANRAKSVMQQIGILHGMVNAGGDLTAWGKPLKEEKWRIGIADPIKQKSYIGWLDITELSVVTSGNYEYFIEVNGQKYGHILDPRTGLPASGIRSVTVISPDAELSDALATSVYVMGVDEGLKLINRLKRIECFIIDESNQYHQSHGLDMNFYDE